MDSTSQGIAIVGLGALFPGSTDRHGFWRDILAGRDLLSDVPASHWLIEDYYDPDPSAPDKVYGRRGGFLSNVDFDPLEFAMPPSILSSTDTSQLLALIVAKQVLDDAAAGQFAGVDRERISVILGVASTTELVVELGSRLQRPIWVKALRELGLPEEEVQQACDRIAAEYVPWTESSFPGLLGNVVAGRIANRLDLGGTNCVIDAACASSLSAVHMALMELHAGHSDLAISGGVDTLNDILMYACFSKTPALSPTGDCRPFSDGADGTILGEGLGMVALKRLADAERDGDRIYAVIRGLGTSSDGKSKSVYAPVPAGQARALRRAYAIAGYSPDTVELMEAHGTATRAGDAAEFESLSSAFATRPDGPRQWCALGSIKSQIGHAKAAAGAAGLFKAVMALHHKVLPPTIKVERPNPNLALDESAFYLNTEARPWIRPADHPRRASVSAFGFGGSNYHVTLEEYTRGGPRPRRSRVLPSELVLLGADSAAELAAECRTIAAATTEPGALEYQAYRSHDAHRPDAAHRLAVIAGSCLELQKVLGQAADRLAAGESDAFALPGGVYYASGKTAGDVAFLFPGQGSQRVGMGADLAMSFDAARAVWDRAADVPLGNAGERLHHAVFPRPVFSDPERAAQHARLTATEWAQPALAATSLACLALLRAAGVSPAAVGGHSFGELTALSAAGALDAADLLRVARRRGELMAAAAAAPGAMTAVAGAVAEVAQRVAAAGIDVVVANHNGPRQVVFSGAVASIEALEQWVAGEEGLSAVRLPVATAFHSPIVAPSVEPFRAFLQDVPLAEPTLPVYANSTAGVYPPGADAARELLARQLAEPVLFAAQVEAMYDAGVRTFVEVGPGAALTGMVERILADRPFTAVAMERRGLSGVTGFWHALGRLAVSGVALDLLPLWDEYDVPADPAARATPKLTVSINGANYGKPYPPPGGAAALPAPNPPRPSEAATPPRRAAIEDVQMAAETTNGRGPHAAPPVHAAPAPAVVSAPPLPAAPAPPPAQAVGATPAAATLPSHLQAMVDMHRETATAHAAYIAAMAESHMAYLTAMSQAMGGGPVADGMAPRQVAIVAPAPASVPTPVAAMPAAAPVAPLVPATPAAHVAPSAPAPVTAAAPAAAAPRVASPPAPSGRPAEASPSGQNESAAPAPGIDLEALLLAVVADKTGYPVEMLDLSLELESGLGIDSIKRVEILSALREQAPGLPEVQPSQLASLRTLAEIIAFMGAHGAGGGNVDPGASPVESVATPVAQPAAPSEAAPSPAAPSLAAQPAAASAASAASAAGAQALDLPALLLEIVADKTGYPVEMLDLSLELESGLGIDSIKRVEILSALRERAPGLPEVQPSQLAALRTLAEIIAFMEQDPARGEDPGGGGDPPGKGKREGNSSQVPPAPLAAEASPAVQTVPPVTLDRFEVQTVPAPAAGFAMSGLVGAAGPILVTDDGRGIAPRLIARLVERGVPAVLSGDAPADGAAGVIHLAGLRTFENADAALAVNRAVFTTARGVAERFSGNGGVFVTVQDTGGDFGVSGAAGHRTWSAGVAGLAKTAAREWPAAAVRAIDIECGDQSPDALAEALALELLAGGAELEVGLSSAGRVTLVVAPASAPDGDWALEPGDVIVATGGARGVTAACLIALAARFRPRIALLGRTPLEPEAPALAGAADEAAVRKALIGLAAAAGEKATPAEIGRRVAGVLAAREVAETMRALEAAGAVVLYFACDAGDAAAVRATLGRVREQWGPVRALLHGAGVLADRLIAQKTDDEFDRVLSAKVGGLRALLHATADDPLRAIVLFSSVAARTGNPGQADYACANEILNKMACSEAARRQQCVVRSIGWGPWDGGMVTPALRGHFDRLGVALIPVGAGAAAFVEEWRHGGAAEIVIGRGAPDADLGGASTRTRSFDLLVSERSYPVLADHTIQDVPVLPAVMVVEWAVRAARGCFPGRGVPRIRDVRVLRGARLEAFHGAGDRFELRITESGDGALAMELRGTGGALHYTLRAEFGVTAGDPPAGTGPGPGDSADLEAWEWPVSELYEDRLFHGPDFQAITSLDGVSATGAQATLTGARALGWAGGWRTDVAALDGMLQLARLWGLHQLGRPSLPTRIEAVELHGDGPLDGPLRCTLRTRAHGELKTVSEISLFRADGRLAARMAGVEMHMLGAAVVA